MKRLLLLTGALAFFAACGGKTTCKDTGCAAGSTCNPTSGMCETSGLGGGFGGGGGGGGGGTTGGGNGTTDAGTGGGGGGTMVVIDPFDDGGTFLPGDICTYAIAVGFDAGVDADGGATMMAVQQIDLSTVGDQYTASCGSSSGSGNDVIYKVTLTEPKGLVVTATNTSADSQDAVLALVNSPCASQRQVTCVDDSGSSSPEVLTVPRLEAGTWYVLVDLYGTSSTPGTMDVQFELVEPGPPGPANDNCSGAQLITFANDAAMVSGTTVNAFNDGAPLSCSADAAFNPDVYYTFTLTAPHDVRVTVGTPTTSSLVPAVGITTTCGASTGARGCGTGGGQFTARALQPGTYFVVVDGDGTDTGEFTLDLALLPPTAVPTNDTCAMATPLAVNASQSIDVNLLTADYTPTCAGSAAGGDAVYTFTTTQAQKVTLTATSVNGSDGVLSLRGAACAMASSEVQCSDESGGGSDEILIEKNLPAGTYFVVLTAYRANLGEFGLSLALDAPVLPPANDTCAGAEMVTLTGGTATRNVDLSAANADYSPDCRTSSTGGDVVYAVEVPGGQTLTVSAMGMGVDSVVQINGATCDLMGGMPLECSDSTYSGDTETATTTNSGATATYFVVIKAYSSSGPVDVTFTVM